MIRRLGLLLVVALAAGIGFPLVAGGTQLTGAALALALAGPAAGVALAAAAGRPLLAGSALAGAGAYASGLLSLRGIPVPTCVVLGAMCGGAGGLVVAAVGTRLDGPRFLVATLLLALLAEAVVNALPGVTGAQSGLGPLPPLGVSIGGYRTAVLTPVGDFHLMVAVAAVSAALAALLVWRGPGPRWRAAGSDSARAAASGLRPRVAQAGALAAAGLLSALSGALAAHVAQAATTQSFALDLAAVPLLAALAANREPLGAALAAVATGALGEVVLPAVGWHGPPDAMAVAIGVLAVGALATLLPGRGRAIEVAEPSIDPAAPWPVAALGLRGHALRVEPVQRRARGVLLVDAPAFSLEAGSVHGLVGPNGAGKTTLLRAIASRGAVDRPGGDAPVLLLPQEGGGFPWCTPAETLRLAASRGRSRGEAETLATAWLARLGIAGSDDRLCAELSTGQRRMLDLARVLLGRPGVLLCDEPLAGLDDAYRAAAAACLRAAAGEGLPILVAEHDRETLGRLADSVLELRPPEAA